MEDLRRRFVRIRAVGVEETFRSSVSCTQIVGVCSASRGMSVAGRALGARAGRHKVLTIRNHAANPSRQAESAIEVSYIVPALVQ